MSSLTLAIDTTTPVGGVALAHEGRIIAAASVETRAAASELVTRLVRDVLGYVGARPESIARVVASRGPGAFTGIRVGLATARALALGWGTEVSTVTAFEAVHAAVGARTSAVLLDARRGQVYAGLVGARSAEGVLIDPAAIADWAREIGRPDVVAGSGVSAHPEAVVAAFPDVPSRPDVLPSAAGVAIACARGLGADILTPLYVRPPDARLPGQSEP